MRHQATTFYSRMSWLWCMPLIALLATGCPPQIPPDPDPGQPTDADNDGVRDNADDCLNTPAGAEVDASGCAESQRDTDEDGVMDDQDDCAGTPAGAEVDAAGCPTVPLPDDDQDGVLNADDQCANTPANTTVDAMGCPITAPGDPDADGDGVGDSIDTCPNTPANAAVDRGGCAATQRDTDNDTVMDDADRCADTPPGTAVDTRGCPILDPGTPDADADGIPDDGDMCADTPADSTVDTNGCAASQRDSDQDGVHDDLDDCPGTTAGTDVDSVGCPIGGGGGGSSCGNGTVETGEECDPPNGSTCDVNCQNTTAGALANNLCANPTAIGNGLHVFSNVGATTDGPEEPGQCVLLDNTLVEADIWYCYTATSTEEVVISLCGSNFDTKTMIYNGCSCPTAAPMACSDDDCGTGTDSRTRINAIDGQDYLIRIGGFGGATGDGGRLTIFPISDPARGTNACNATAGDCFTAHANPGCATPATCTATCTVDQVCCDLEWDSLCATKADGIANGFTQCGAAAGGSCFDPSPTGGPVRMGCDDATCCQTVCTNDPFCCLNEWDAFCADAVAPDCGLFAACANSVSSCFSVHAGPGCSLDSCCNMVCENDPACCGDSGWDDVCVGAANTLRQAGQCLP